MLRRLFAAALILPMIAGFSSCKGREQAGKVSEDVRKYYGAVSAISTQYKVVSDYNDRVNEFTLAYSADAGKAPTVAILAPEEIKGISAAIDKGTLNLSYEGSSLSMQMPEIKGFTPLEAFPALLLDVAGAIPTEVDAEKIDDVSCAALTYESAENNRAVSKRVWFDMDTLHPVKADFYLDGKCVISLDFLKFDAK